MPDDPGERRWRAEFYPPLVSERREVITSGNPKVIFSVIGGDPGRRRNEQGGKPAPVPLRRSPSSVRVASRNRSESIWCGAHMHGLITRRA